MANTLVPIYILRSQCKEHKLDTMRTFTLKGNESPDKAFEQMEAWVRKRFPIIYRCTHKIKFTRSVDSKYRYNTKKKKVEHL